MPLRHAEQHQHQLPHATAEVKRQAKSASENSGSCHAVRASRRDMVAIMAM